MSGQKEFFHRRVVCATIEENPHLILGQEMLRPRDGGEKDAEKLFEKGEGKKQEFQRDNKRIECWDVSGFEMEGLEKAVRVVR